MLNVAAQSLCPIQHQQLADYYHHPAVQQSRSSQSTPAAAIARRRQGMTRAAGESGYAPSLSQVWNRMKLMASTVMGVGL